MGRKVDPRDFLLNTDYEMDKIVYFKEGSVSTTDPNDVIFPHKLNFTPLVFGICATKEDFSDSRSIPFQMQTRDSQLFFNVFADNTNIRISSGAYNSVNRMYYRIYAFEPSNSRAKVGATAKHAKQFILNTDYNYCKLYKAGVTNGATQIVHNFGYIPQTLAWRTESSWTFPIEQALESDPSRNVTFTNNQINFPGAGIHYRIYYDEA